MKYTIIWISALAIAIILILSCNKEDEGPLYIVTKKTLDGAALTINQAELYYAFGHDSTSLENIQVYTADVWGKFTAIDTSVYEYGHVWSSDANDTLPVIITEGDNYTTFNNPPIVNTKFKSTLTGLSRTTKYYVRSYVKYNDQVVGYSPFVHTFSTKLDSNYWLPEQSTITIQKRKDAVSFAIGNKAYLGTGIAGANNLQQDFWEFNAELGTWSEVAQFMGGKRAHAVGFAINGKGYVGTGEDENGEIKKDIWEYNPENNTWIPRAAFGPGSGVAVKNAVSFVIDGKAYVGTGANRTAPMSIFAEYDPSENEWNPRESFGGGTGILRDNAVAFAVGNSGYIGLGVDGNGVMQRSFYEYNPDNNSWSEVAAFPGTSRIDAVGFALVDPNDDNYANNGGYVGFGTDGTTYYNDLWRYDHFGDYWEPRASCTGAGRIGANYFVISGIIEGHGNSDRVIAYVGFGYNGDYLDNFWKFLP